MPLKKLKPEETSSTSSLIAAIERKDRRFRLFQTIFMVGTFIALIVIIGAQQRTLDGVEEQLSQAKSVAAEQSKRANESDDKIERRLDCMVVFFTQKDRNNLSITDIDKCTLDKDGDLQQFFRTNEQGETETTPTEQPSNLTPSTSSAQNNGAGNGNGQENKPERKPVQIDLPLLPPIPVCVPITEICMVQ